MGAGAAIAANIVPSTAKRCRQWAMFSNAWWHMAPLDIR